MLKVVLVAMLAYLPMMGQDKPLVDHWLTLSQAAMIAAQGADTVTTIRASRAGGVETNPLGLQGVIAAKSIVVPVAIWGQRRSAREHSRAAKWMMVINWAVSGEIGWAAWHNSRLSSR